MRTLLFISFIFQTLTSISQNDSIQLDAKYGDKVNTLDAIISTLYGVISGDKGEERNWELFSYLYTSDAKMIPTGQAKTGEYKWRYTTANEYIESSGAWLVENGFYEEEIHREVQRFGNIAHVFSTYHCFHSKKDKEPFMRGINSIQLVYDNSRWWVVNIYWAQESESNPIPAQYLDK